MDFFNGRLMLLRTRHNPFTAYQKISDK